MINTFGSKVALAIVELENKEMNEDAEYVKEWKEFFSYVFEIREFCLYIYRQNTAYTWRRYFGLEQLHKYKNTKTN